MSKFLEYILNWWVSRPSNIFINGVTCSILPEHWSSLSWTNVLGLTIIPVLISIVLCYTFTRSLGRSFLIRWWIFNIITAIAVAILIYVFMISKTFVSGLSDSLIYWSLPNFIIMNRCIVGFLQSILYFFIFSTILVKILGGGLNIPKFKNNLSYPFPKLFKA